VFRGLISTLLAVGLLAACAEEADLPAPAPRQPAPEFSLPLLGTGNEVSLASLRGKIVVIDFWATWCVPCEFQVPALNAFYEAHRGDSDVALFGVSIDTEGAEDVAEWVVEKGVRYPILLAGGDDLAREFGAEGFPTVVIVRGDGTIDSRHSGLIQLAELEEILVAIRNAG
jgi:thiol-disulfide isomerase/thioredoxin